ncbi:response regulator [Neotamlana laminarinivorans]|uniref:Response regulator n=1 Tax=Neotamlana laminarinivorans TaxID=2883124 RepID=A0A9X1HZ12_9FLAO|nr:response regulator [Tamlana laminarinivorans]MCB4797915.1 response regulator [Tamlana laminarinivorans]
MKKILLVDDDLIYLKITTHILNKSSENKFEVYSADSADTALQMLNKNYFDFIFLDINMPIISGWEFLKLFSEQQYNKLPTIFITSSTIDPKEKEKARNHELVHSFIEKPITNNIILNFKQTFFN